MSSKNDTATRSGSNATSPRGRTTKASAPLESTIQADIRVAFGKLPHVVLWRNNTGAFRTEGGGMMRTGLCVGSSDLIGILAPMGRFLALEVKRPGEKPTKEQEMFLELVRKSGGVAAVVHSVEEALAVVGPDPATIPKRCGECGGAGYLEDYRGVWDRSCSRCGGKGTVQA